MKESVADLVLGVSTVVYGSAIAIRGLVDGEPVRAIIGMSIVALVAAAESASRFGWLEKVAASGRFRRRANTVSVVVESKGVERTILVVAGASAINSAVRCVVAATRHDPGAWAFYAVMTAASVGILISFASLSRRRLERNEKDGGRSSAPATP